MYECKECGYKIESENQGAVCPVCNKPMVNTDEDKAKNKKAWSFKSIAITILAIVVGRFVGGYLGGEMAKDINENSAKSDMDSFIEQVEKYVPGKVTAGRYESDYWNIAVSPEGDWVEMDASEKREAESVMAEAGKTAAIREVENSGVSDELLEKYKETLYWKVETGYNCISDDVFVGQALFVAYSGYGVDKMSETEVTSQLLSEFKSELKNAKTGTSYFGNEKYEYIDGVFQEGDVAVNMRVYIRTKGVMINMVQLMYVDGEEDVVTTFENSISAAK